MYSCIFKLTYLRIYLNGTALVLQKLIKANNIYIHGRVNTHAKRVIKFAAIAHTRIPANTTAISGVSFSFVRPDDCLLKASEPKCV